MFRKLKQLFCRHVFDIAELQNNGAEYERTDKRVTWPCAKCKKEFTAHCGLDIAPRNGKIINTMKFDL